VGKGEKKRERERKGERERKREKEREKGVFQSLISFQKGEINRWREGHHCLQRIVNREGESERKKERKKEREREREICSQILEREQVRGKEIFCKFKTLPVSTNVIIHFSLSLLINF
jgi:hypothetical protein